MYELSTGRGMKMLRRLERGSLLAHLVLQYDNNSGFYQSLSTYNIVSPLSNVI